VRITPLPPVLTLLVAYTIESYCLTLARFPVLRKVLKEPEASEASFMNLQPSLFTICTHLIASDAEARKPLEDGGLGYQGVYTTMEGMCEEMRLWVEKYGSKTEEMRLSSGAEKVAVEVRNVGGVAGSVKA
jgi:hypothetical protein